VVVSVVDAGDVRDCEAMFGRCVSLDAIASGERTLMDDPQIASGPAGRREQCGKSRVVHADTQFVTGHPGFAHFENNIADSPALTNYRRSDVDSLCREILAERARSEWVA